MESGGLRVAIALVLAFVLGMPMITVAAVASIGSTGDGTGDLVVLAPGGQLRADAPIRPEWVPWVNRAGTLCREISPALVAAQIDAESSWNPDARAYNPPDHGGDAQGLGQFQAGTWASWGKDFDGDGVNSPFDPEDAIMGLGTLMCDLVRWAEAGIADGSLHGDPVDIALSAYNCGRGCVENAGGVPKAGQAHDYPGRVRALLSKYAAAPVGTGAWQMPLPPGKYSVGSGFGPRGNEFHRGVDLIAGRGTPILAASAGTVARVVCDKSTSDAVGSCDVDGSPSVPGCGWFLEIRHAGDITTRYCHQLRRPLVDAGQTVVAGQQIGVVGTSGHSSGPHLHFEVHTTYPATNSNAINPITFLVTVGVHP